MSDPAALANSKRRYEKRVYTPLVVTLPRENQPIAALTLATQVRALTISPSELAALRQRVANNPGEANAVDAIDGLGGAVSLSDVLIASARLAKASTSDLSGVASELQGIRSDAAGRIVAGLRALDQQRGNRAVVHSDPSPPALPAAAGAGATPSRPDASAADDGPDGHVMLEPPAVVVGLDVAQV